MDISGCVIKLSRNPIGYIMGCKGVVSLVQVFVNVKTIGKRRPVLQAVAYELPTGLSQLRGLLTAVVKREVDGYNHRQTDVQVIPFLTQQQIDDQSISGKIHFDRIHSNKKADLDHAIHTVLQGFEDGLFRVLINNNEVKTLDEQINLREGDTLTFIRLTFLSGRSW